MASVARTGRLLCVGESWPWGGVTAEVVARVASEGFGLLDAPPQRLNAKDTPVPYHPEPLGGPSAHRPQHRRCRAPALTVNCVMLTRNAFGHPQFRLIRSHPLNAMPQIPIIMPQLGESIAEATVVSLLVQPGDSVEADQDIIEVETNKATMNVASPCPGRVEKFLVKPERKLSGRRRAGLPGSQPGRRRAAGSGHAASGKGDGETAEGRDAAAPARQTDESCAESVAADRARAARAGQCRRRQLHVAAHESAHEGTGPARGRPGGLPGSGAAGRVTIQDFEKFIANLEKHKLSQASTMRVAVADAMRRSWTRPLATVGCRFALMPLLNHRKTCQSQTRPGAVCACAPWPWRWPRTALPPDG